MFLGRHATTLKNADRLPIPPRWRALTANGAYLTQGFDRNVMILPAETFQLIYEQVTTVNLTDPLARLLLRTLLGTATYFEQTEDEAAPLPENLAGYAHLAADVVLVGQGTYVEVWSAELWREQEAELANPQADPQRFSAFTITMTQN